jgi:PAS domain S-box-containing protein
VKEERRTKRELIEGLGELPYRLTTLEKLKQMGDYKKDFFQLAQLALNNSTDAMAWISKDARILYVNNKACKLLGYSRAELLKKTVHDIDPAYTPEVWRNYWKELRLNGSLSFETVAQKKDGSIIPMEITANYFKHRNEEYHFMFSKDISKRKEVERELKEYRDHLEELVNKRTVELSKANQKLKEEINERTHTEKELRESEERYQKLLETANDAIFIADAETGIILNANKKAGELLGIPPEKIIGMHQKHMHAKEDEAYYRKLFLDNAQKEGGIILDDICIWHKNGYRVPVEISSSAVRVGGKFVMQGIFRDITERKKAEESLKKSEEKYYNLIEHANDAILSINREGTIIGFNLRAEKMFGYAREEILGKPSYLLVVQQHRENQKRKLKAFAKAGTSLSTENKINEGKGLRKDGREFDVEFSYYILDIHGERIATAMIRDISERKEADKKLTNYQKQLRSLTSQITLTEEKERRRFAEFLHDEIGQHLFATQLQLQLLKGSLSSAKNTKILDNAINYIKKVIDQSRSLTFELSSPILYELGFEKALEWLVEQAREKYDIIVTLKDDKQEKPLDDDVKILLYQAVRELLINVAKHAKTKNASVSVNKENSNIRICVKDNGVGFVPPNKHSSDTKIEGFGLFRISERLDQLGGQIEIESQPNSGTQVTLVAPLGSSVEE